MQNIVSDFPSHWDATNSTQLCRITKKHHENEFGSVLKKFQTAGLDIDKNNEIEVKIISFQ